MIESQLERRLALLPHASRMLATLTSDRKNQILLRVAERIREKTKEILSANRDDLNALDESKSKQATPAFRDRLTLNEKRLEQMCESIRVVAGLEDPVGEIVESRVLENGLAIRRVRSPLGAILMIFESRPNVITEVFSLALKSGNSIALRGGSDSRATAAVLYRLIDEVLGTQLKTALGLDPALSSAARPFVGIDDYDRDLVGRLLQRKDIFDICIPRGGNELIERVTRESKMPVIKNDKGVCHLYVHEAADLDMAARIAVNAKTQRPGVCNAIETLLLDSKTASAALGAIVPILAAKGVEFYVCEESHRLLQKMARTDGIESPWASAVHPASDADFYREYLELKLNIKIVENLERAIQHIEKYGSGHSESIITKDSESARRFQSEVDSACVYWNASTRFTDGFALGLGGEIGISTQKLHVRGPVGLRELTSVRWLIDGTGQIRD